MKTFACLGLTLAAIFCVSVALPAAADELWGAATGHGIDTPFTLKTGEAGRDLQVGWRGDKIEALNIIGKPSPYVLASVILNDQTSLIAAGVSWKIGSKFYIRPGIGLAVHDGPIPRAGANQRRTDLGSRILFEPEFAVGLKLTERLTIEGSWVHVSNATLLSRQNPGLDLIGIRLAFGLK